MKSVPNILTILRILAIPGILAASLYWGANGAVVAFALFVAAACTDFLDGYLARTLNVVSSLGRMLDPIADKMLVLAVLFLLIANGTLGGVHLWAAFVILSREVFVSGLREFMADKNFTVHVTKLAKWKTTVQMLALAVLLLVPVWPSLLLVGLVLFWVAAVLTAQTGIQYFVTCWPELRDKKT